MERKECGEKGKRKQGENGRKGSVSGGGVALKALNSIVLGHLGGSGHDLRVLGSSPALHRAPWLSGESASPSAPSPCALSL